MPPHPSDSNSAAPLWRALLARLALVAAAAFVALLADGRGLAFLVAAFGLLAILALQTHHLASMQRWLRSGDDTHFPGAGGEMGALFLELSRRLRDVQMAGQAAVDEQRALVDAIDALPDGVILLDPHNQILWCSRRAETHLGIDARRDVGIVLPQLLRVPGVGEYLARKDNDEPFVFPGPLAPNRIYSLEIVDYGLLRKLAVTLDITDLRRADAMRRDFVANVSHELRTPLTVVSGFLEHLASGEDVAAEDRQRFINLMNEQAQRMLRLVDDLLTLSRLDAADGPQNEEYIDLAEFIARLMRDAESLSGGRHRLILEGEPRGRLRGSRHELQSAFGNLLSNAIRYTPQGGEVRVGWQMLGSEGVFSVKDSGVGIAPEHIPRLTERFYRVDKSRSRETGGTGLGLAIVKNALLRHQAQLEIVSSPGAGSTFSARFPQWRCHP